MRVTCFAAAEEDWGTWEYPTFILLGSMFPAVLEEVVLGAFDIQAELF
jgi:hypothetical protein